MTDHRRILHCDMDCFYAAVHQRDDPSLRGKPVLVGGTPEGRGVVAAASYEAREYGIHSAMPAARAKRLCPHAIFLRSDFSRYRSESRKIFDIYRRFTPHMQTMGLDEAYLDVTETHEPFGTATEVARQIRRLVKSELDLTVSVGVAPNPLVAKIASDHDKPDGLTVVPPERVQAFLDPLSVRKLPGVGPRTHEMLQAAGIETIRQLRQLPLREAIARLGKRGHWLHAAARGRDERPVETSWIRKSLSHERTYDEDLVALDDMVAELAWMSEEVAEGLSKRRFWACTVTIKVRYGDFTTVTRSHTLPGPTQHPETIRVTALELLERTEAATRPVRLLGVGASNLIQHDDPMQLSLFA